MAARSGMSSLVSYLRQYGQAATDDEFHGVTYWTDDQLQEILDNRARYGVIRLLQRDLDELIFGFDLPRHYWPEDDAFSIVDSNEDAVSTTFAYNEQQKLLTFTAALDEDEVYYAVGPFYNMYEALADLWGEKASQRYQYVDFKAGTNRMYMEQEYAHCIERQNYYRHKIAKRLSRARDSRWAT